MRQVAVGILAVVLGAGTLCAGDGRNAADLYREAFALKCFADQDRLDSVVERRLQRAEVEGAEFLAEEALPELMAASMEVTQRITTCKQYIRGELVWEDVEGSVAEHSKAISLALRASRLRECDWGYPPAAVRGPDLMRRLQDEYARVQRLCLLITVQAVRCAETGDSRKAVRLLLDALSVARHARQIGDEGPSWADGYKLQTLLDGMRRVVCYVDHPGLVGVMQREVDQLAEGLAEPEAIYDAETEHKVEEIKHMSDETADEVREKFAKEGMRAVFEGREGVIREYRRLRASIRPLLRRPAGEAMARLLEMSEELPAGATVEEEDGPILHLDVALAAHMNRYFVIALNIYAHGLAEVRSAQAALVVYGIGLRTGVFPERLPAGLPVDPISGEAFRYERTGDGFVLETAPDPVRKEPWRWEIRRRRTYER